VTAAGTATDLELVEANWLGDIEPRADVKAGQATVQITTMNKVEYCINNIRALGESPEIFDAVHEFLIVDQGTQKVQDHEDFEEVVKPLSGKFRIINQGNLGGSGGFSRGMFEAVNNGSDYVLLLDDDVIVEPESILRMVTFANYCKEPTIVGAHMFDMFDRSVLHAFGEVVDPWRNFYAKPHDDMAMGHNLGHHNLRNTPWLHRRVDVDYNGWWMCLIPTTVIKEIGLSLPLFLKWDDAEYGLRAKACPSPVRACGTCPGPIRMTRSAGRRTTTSATASLRRCCTRPSIRAAACCWSPCSWMSSTPCPCSTTLRLAA